VEAAKRFAPQSSRDRKIVAFHTKDPFYTHEASRMASSAERLGLSVFVTPWDGTGVWVRNASMKPTFLLEERQANRGPLLYVDVDCVFHNDPWPVLAGHDGDVSVYYTEPDAKYGGDRVLVSATILLNDTTGARRLLEIWKQKCDENPDIFDQKVLQEILEEDAKSNNPQFKVSHLPASLCWIFDRGDGVKDTVHIEQLQASRAVDGTQRRFFAKKKLRRRWQRIKDIEKALEG
jgi:hypothetical protein